MLVRILNALRSRIWDMVLFLFSDYLNLRFNSMECVSRLWSSGKLNSKGLTLKLLSFQHKSLICYLLLKTDSRWNKILCWIFFQVSLMIRWYCNLSLYMIHLSLYCRNTSFLSMRVIRCMMHISHQEYRDILELDCIHSFWSQHTEKRNNTISQMRLRSVFKIRTSILNTATTEQMGYGIISFFVCFL